MYEVYVGGWKAEREVLPISFVKVVQKHHSPSLREAKKVLDAFAEQGEVVLKFETLETATRFSEAVVALGAVCDVRTEE